MGYEAYKYNQTFSGTDTIAFIIMPECTPICLGSLTTISYSILRNKKPVINIGRTNVNGFTRGSRICAGTMIFTLINQHWVREMQEMPQMSYLKEIPNLKADELPMFDIMIISANEYGSWCSMYIYGIDFSDEAQTISVEDLFTENVFQFVARDVSTFKKGETLYNKSSKQNTFADRMTDMIVTSEDTYIISGSGNTLDDIINDNNTKEKEKINRDRIIRENKDNEPNNITRDLYLKPTGFIVGDDVLKFQQMLKTLFKDMPTNGIFDSDTDKYTKQFQKNFGLPADGIITPLIFPLITGIIGKLFSKDKDDDDDDEPDEPEEPTSPDPGIMVPDSDDENPRTYYGVPYADPPDSKMPGMVQTEDELIKWVTINNVMGSRIYYNPDLNADVVGLLEYGDAVKIYDNTVHSSTGGGHRFGPEFWESEFWETDKGYIKQEDTFNEKSLIEKVTDDPTGSPNFINNIKHALSKLYNYLPIDNSKIDDTDWNYYKWFCEDNGIVIPEEDLKNTRFHNIDRSSYLLLMEKADIAVNATEYIKFNYGIEFSMPPDTYKNILTYAQILDMFSGIVACGPNGINTKVTATARYPSGATKQFSSTLHLSNNEAFGLSSLGDAFIYDIMEGNDPEVIEIVVYPYDRDPFKWIFDNRR